MRLTHEALFKRAQTFVTEKTIPPIYTASQLRSVLITFVQELQAEEAVAKEEQREAICGRTVKGVLSEPAPVKEELPPDTKGVLNASKGGMKL